MGKVRRNRLEDVKAKLDPIGLQDENGQDGEEEEQQEPASGANFLATIAEELQQLSSSRRQAAAVKFSSWLSEITATSKVVSIDLAQLSPVISHLLVHLSESNVSERYSMIHAVSLISTISPEISEHLVAKDALTPLVACLELYGPDILKDHKWDIGSKSIVKSLMALTNLCSNSPSGIDILLRSSQFVFNFLVECLTYSAEMIAPGSKAQQPAHASDEPMETVEEEKNMNYAIAIEAAKCLEVLVEDRKLEPNIVALLINAIDAIQAGLDGRSSASTSISAVQKVHLQAICSLLRFSICKSNDTDTKEIYASQTLIVQLTGKVLRLDAQPALEKLMEFISKDEENDLLYHLIRNISLAKQSSLEGLCNALCPDDDEEELEEYEDEMECDQQDEEQSGLEGLNGSSSILQPELVNQIMAQNIFQGIIDNIVILTPDVRKVLENHFVGKMVLGLFADERERSCAALSTLLSILPLNLVESSFASLSAKLNELCKSLATSGSEADVIQTGELFRVLSRVASLPLTFAQVGLEVSALGLLASKAISHTNSNLEFSVRCNAIHAVAKMSSKPDTPLPFVQDSTKYLCDILDAWSAAPAEQVPLEKLTLVGEIFDSLMDMFASDGQVNEIFTSLGLLPKLRDMAPKFSQQVKFFVRKRDLTRNSPLSDINRNLSRFITYKAQTLK